jgi:parallel beta-helix repeat protein
MNGRPKRSFRCFVIFFLLFALALFPAKGRTDTNDFLWVRTAGGGGADVGHQIAVDNAGNSYIVGYFNSTNFSIGGIVLTNNFPSSPTWDGFIAKYDTAGNVVWATKFGGTNNDRGWGIAVDTNRNCYVTGFFSSTNFLIGGVTLTNFSPNGNNSVFVAKLDTDGNLLWAHGPDAGYNSSGYQVAADNAGNCYVTGNFYGTNTFGGIRLVSSGSSDAFLLKYDPAGNLLWARQAGGTGLDGGIAVALDTAGNPYLLADIRSTNAAFGSIALSVRGTNTCQNFVVAKYDQSGNALWAKAFGGISVDSATGIAVDKSNNCYITGNTSSSNVYFGSIIVSNAYNLLPDTALFIAKLNPSGNPVWAVAGQGNNNVASMGIALDPFGNSYIAGFFLSATFALGGVTLTNTEPNPISGGPADIFVARFDPYGNLMRIIQVTGTNDQRAFSIAVDSKANPYITGWTQGTNVLFGSIAVTNAYLDLFVAKLDPDYPVLQMQSGNDPAFCMPGLMVLLWPMNKTPSANITLEGSTNFTTWTSANVLAFLVDGDRNGLVIQPLDDHMCYRLRFDP